MCHDHLAERGLAVIMRGSDTDNKPTTKESTKESAKKSPRVQSSEVESEKINGEVATVAPGHMRSQSSARDILLPLASSLDQTGEDSTEVQNESLAEQKMNFAGMQGGSVAGDFQALSITKQRLDGERRKREEVERAIIEVKSAEELDL